MRSAVVTLGLALVVGCSTGEKPMDLAALTGFATRYTAAWNSGDPAQVASFYADTGSLTINAGEPAAGRAAITEVARGFMTAFPDIRVMMDSVVVRDGGGEYHWTFTGTNTGPAGTGRAVRISGYEEWTMGADGLVAVSLGHYDEADYQRQVNPDSVTAP